MMNLAKLCMPLSRIFILFRPLQAQPRVSFWGGVEDWRSSLVSQVLARVRRLWAIATALSMPAYRVDTARLVSKYIGETSKNLGRILDEAERARGGAHL